MKKALIKKIIPTLLIMCLFIPYAGATRKNVYGDNKQDELDEAQNKKQEIGQQIEDTKSKISQLQQQSSDTQSYIDSLDGMISEIDTSLYNLRMQIADLENQIAEAEAGLIQAQADSEDQYDAMKLRIKYMYEHNGETYLALILTSQSMGEMLNRAEYVSKISQYDREMLTKYQETVNYIAQTKLDLENDYNEVSVMQQSLAAQKESLAYAQQIKNTELIALKNQTSEAENLQASLETDFSVIDARITNIEAQMKEQESDGSGGITLPNYDGGKFKWPTVNTYITSNFGDMEDRTEPHKGIDVAPVSYGVSGDPIYAMYDGTVVEAYNNGQSNGGAGNYITIYHGDGLYTRYLHCSAVFVKKEQTVSRGDVIAIMGTTGNSTGVHLHFDVRLNGTYVNPWNYLG